MDILFSFLLGEGSGVVHCSWGPGVVALLLVVSLVVRSVVPSGLRSEGSLVSGPLVVLVVSFGAWLSIVVFLVVLLMYTAFYFPSLVSPSVTLSLCYLPL